MRPDPHPGFIEEPSGKVLHKTSSVRGDEVPMLVKTPEEIKADIAAKEAKEHAAEAERQADEARKEAEQTRKKNANDEAASGNEKKTTQGTNGQG
jgi:hypothetical protein